MTSDRQGRLFAGLLLLLVGLAFFFRNIGWFDFDWELVRRFWPLLLIVIGLRLLIKNTTAYMAVVVTIVGATLLLVLYAPEPLRTQLRDTADRKSESQGKDHFDETLESSTDQLAVRLDFSGDVINVRGLEDSSKAYEAKFKNAGKIDDDDDQEDGRLEISLRQESPLRYRGASAEIALTPNVPVELELLAGVEQIALDLSKLNVERIILDPRVDHVRADIRVGASPTTLKVPRGAGIEVTADSVLDSSKLQDIGLVREGNAYRSEGFALSQRKVTIHLTGSNIAQLVKLER